MSSLDRRAVLAAGAGLALSPLAAQARERSETMLQRCFGLNAPAWLGSA